MPYLFFEPCNASKKKGKNFVLSNAGTRDDIAPRATVEKGPKDKMRRDDLVGQPVGGLFYFSHVALFPNFCFLGHVEKRRGPTRQTEDGASCAP